MFDSPERRREFLLNLLALVGVTIIVSVLLILGLYFFGDDLGLGRGLLGRYITSGDDEYASSDAEVDTYDDSYSGDDYSGDGSTADDSNDYTETTDSTDATTDSSSSSSSESESPSSDTSSAGNVALTRPKVVSYTNSAGTRDYAYFFSYVNNGDSPVYVNGFEVTVQDGTGATIDEPMYNYAPNILDAGKSGYAAYIGLNFNNNYPESGVSVNATADFDPETQTEGPLKCTSAQLVTPTAGNTIEGNVEGQTVAVSISNTTSTAYQYAHVVVGLIDASDTLIGAATGTADALDPNGQIEMECDKIVLLDGYTIDDVAKIRARARPGPEESGT